jgi:uncharacterized HAD superfamily protein
MKVKKLCVPTNKNRNFHPLETLPQWIEKNEILKEKLAKVELKMKKNKVKLPFIPDVNRDIDRVPVYT